MRRDRSQAVVVQGDRILMIQERIGNREFFNLPGGGIEQGETPEEAALRELQEETNVKGRIIRKLSVQYKSGGRGEVHTFLVELEDGQTPSRGRDPELEHQTIIGIGWKSLTEISERDRMYLWSAGLLRVDQFHQEIENWGDDISYPV